MRLHLFGVPSCAERIVGPIRGGYFLVQTGDSATEALMTGARRSDRVAGHGDPGGRGLRGALLVLMRSAPSHNTSDSSILRIGLTKLL